MRMNDLAVFQTEETTTRSPMTHRRASAKRSTARQKHRFTTLQRFRFDTCVHMARLLDKRRTRRRPGCASARSERLQRTIWGQIGFRSTATIKGVATDRLAARDS